MFELSSFSSLVLTSSFSSSMFSACSSISSSISSFKSVSSLFDEDINGLVGNITSFDFRNTFLNHCKASRKTNMINVNAVIPRIKKVPILPTAEFNHLLIKKPLAPPKTNQRSSNN